MTGDKNGVCGRVSSGSISLCLTLKISTKDLSLEIMTMSLSFPASTLHNDGFTNVRVGSLSAAIFSFRSSAGNPLLAKVGRKVVQVRIAIVRT